MDEVHFNLIFVGGGIAASLAAIRLHETRPDVRFVILDAHDMAHVSQTLSFQAIPGREKTFEAPEASWLRPWISVHWPRYEVRFPDFERIVESPYYSIRVSEFYPKLRHRLGHAHRPNHKVRAIEGSRVRLEDGREYTADVIIDARGAAADQQLCAYQKFVGLNIVTAAPHGLRHPILMDAKMKQLDGFRFFYVLPWSDDALLIEDTRYSDSPMLDEEDYKRPILDYAARQGWRVKEVLGVEKGVLSIPFHGCAQPMPDGGIGIGLRAGLFHPTTGYSIYEAIRAAERLADLEVFTHGNAECVLSVWARRRWNEQEFYRRLNNMMFFAAPPEQRYRVLEHFYRRESDLLSRFYGGVTSMADKALILSGRPPVPMGKGLYHFFHRKEAGHENV